MKFLDFFAGVGGFRRGMELAGHDCVGFCEYDNFAVASYTAMHLATNEQLASLSEMPLKRRQKEILKSEYRNGEWYARDITELRAADIPRSDCWTLGAPCQDFSVAGKRAGLNGNRSVLVKEIFRLLGEMEEADRPRYLVYENVKGMLSANRGWDFAAILFEMARLGYSVGWQILNTKDFGIPQSRERVFVAGFFGSECSGKIFPIAGTGAENNLKQISSGRQAERVYDPCGLARTLIGDGGGLGAKTGLYAISFCDLNYGESVLTSEARRLQARYCKGVANHKGETSGVAVPILTPDPCSCREGKTIRNKVWSDKLQCCVSIRRLTPRECFRLQGLGDDYFDKAQLVNSDNQLYKQAGNGVTVAVVKAIAERMKV